jgi:hypothetical protein
MARFSSRAATRASNRVDQVSHVAGEHLASAGVDGLAQRE